MIGGSAIVAPTGEIAAQALTEEDELITTTYKLDDINQGYADMHAGKNIRGVIVY